MATYGKESLVSVICGEFLD